MKSNIGITSLIFVMFIIQLIISVFFDYQPIVYITLLPLMVISFPIEMRSYKSLPLAFLLGLLIDLLVDGVLGLNAGAATLLSLFRRPLSLFIFGEEKFSRSIFPTIRESSLVRHIFFFVVSISIFMLFYMSFDGVLYRGYIFNLVRFGITLVANLMLYLLIDLLVLNREGYKSNGKRF
jgi:hypothetical protein